MSTVKLARLAIIGVFVALIWIGICETAAKAGVKAAEPAPVQWPETPCRLANRMDIAIVDGLFFECTCVRLHIGYQCDWMIIAGVSSRPIRRIRRHARRIAILPAIPAVVS